MRASVIAAVSGAVGVAIGVVAALAVAGADEPVDRSDVTVEAPVDCTDVISDDVLAALAWTDPSTRPEERLGRCEWFGEQGNVTAGTLVAPLSEKCDQARERDGYQAGTSWLEEPTVTDGCVVVNEEGIGLYEVLTQVDGEVVQVRVALIERRPVDDVRAALQALVAAAPRAAG